MRDLEDFLPRVMQMAPQCPEPLAIEKLRDAARTFLRRTRLWRDEDSFPVTVSGSEGISASDEAEIEEFSAPRFVETDGDASNPINLTAKTIAELDRDSPNWRNDEGTPEFITQINRSTVRLTPKGAGTLTLEMILIPKREALSVPDFLFEEYDEVIAQGALGAVLAIPGDYQNLDLAAVNRKDFMDALDMYGAKASKGQQRARRRVPRSMDF